MLAGVQYVQAKEEADGDVGGLDLPSVGLIMKDRKSN